MKISGEQNQYQGYISGLYPQTQQKAGNDFSSNLSAAYRKAERQEKGDVLGLTTIKDPKANRFWGMIAKYAECSTPDNPVIYVESNYGGKTVSYNIYINEVNPDNASRMEIFALCSWADDVGKGDNSTFGTYMTLRSYEEMACNNGYVNSQPQELGTFEQFINEKRNWVDMSKKVMSLLLKCNDLFQYKKGMDIMDLFSKFPVTKLV